MHKPQNVIAKPWPDYELLDSGSGRKLERFGKVILDRPEVNANGKSKLTIKEWREIAHSRFEQKGSNSGTWSKPIDDWTIKTQEPNSLTFNLSQSQFKHIGVFPEQSSNWDYIFKALHGKKTQAALNLFAYTGGASLAAKAAGADITHIEAFGQLITKAKENMESTGLADIRWIKEDALKFVQKAIKREKKYDLIVMDPPSWGRGPKGEKWIIEKHLDELISGVSKLMNPKAHLIVNTYSGILPEELKYRLDQHIKFTNYQVGSLILQAKSGTQFSTGTLVRGQVR